MPASSVLDKRILPTEMTAGAMKGLVFHGPFDIRLDDVPMPRPGIGEVVVRVHFTTICATDLAILKGEYPIRPGLVIGHEAVGIVHEVGAGVTGFRHDDRVLVSAITPCGQCFECLAGHPSQCGGGLGGWRMGNTVNGTQAEFVLVPHAQANLVKIPADLSDEQVLLLTHVGSTGLGAVESAGLQLGDTVAIFAQGPIGLCATAGAKLRGAAFIVAIEGNPDRAKVAQRMGADIVLDPADDPVQRVRELTGGRGVDVAIEALGTQETFENALRILRPGGTLSSVGVYTGKLTLPPDVFRAGLGDYRIVTTLCPGGKERLRRLMELVRHGRLDLRPLITHRFRLDEIVQAYKLIRERGHGVIKVAIRAVAAMDDEC